MTNLLGKTWLAQDFNNNKTLNLAAWKNFPEVIDITLYGKTQPTTNRKMGHFITYSNDKKTSYLRYLSDNNLIPDGVANKKANMYFKPFGGQNTKTHTHMANGGWLDSYKPGGERPPIVVDNKNKKT
jgi:hypothetical protein